MREVLCRLGFFLALLAGFTLTQSDSFLVHLGQYKISNSLLLDQSLTAKTSTLPILDPTVFRIHSREETLYLATAAPFSVPRNA